MITSRRHSGIFQTSIANAHHALRSWSLAGLSDKKQTVFAQNAAKHWELIASRRHRGISQTSIANAHHALRFWSLAGLSDKKQTVFAQNAAKHWELIASRRHSGISQTSIANAHHALRSWRLACLSDKKTVFAQNAAKSWELIASRRHSGISQTSIANAHNALKPWKLAGLNIWSPVFSLAAGVAFKSALIVFQYVNEIPPATWKGLANANAISVFRRSRFWINRSGQIIWNIWRPRENDPSSLPFGSASSFQALIAMLHNTMTCHASWAIWFCIFDIAYHQWAQSFCLRATSEQFASHRRRGLSLPLIRRQLCAKSSICNKSRLTDAGAWPFHYSKTSFKQWELRFASTIRIGCACSGCRLSEGRHGRALAWYGNLKDVISRIYEFVGRPPFSAWAHTPPTKTYPIDLSSKNQ